MQREIVVRRYWFQVSETRKLSVKCGQVWEDVADQLCNIREPTFTVDQWAVRDHYKKLVTWFKRKLR